MSLETTLMTFCFCLGALRAAASQTAAPAEGRPGDILPYQATEATLPNGLKAIVVPTGMPNLVSLQIPVQTGSRNEVEPGKTGFAHFFEHMMFRGTKKYPPEAYEAIMTKAGARQNAYTTDDFTNYHVTFAKQDLAKILEVEADRFQNLAYTEEQFRTEARAVLGEYNKNSSDPLNKLFEVISDAAYEVHPYKHTTMGFLEDIEAMPDQIEYAKLFFDRWYRPEYTTLIVAGDVRPEEVLPLVEQYWGGWERGSYKAEIPAEPPPDGPVYAHVPWEQETNPYLAVAFHGPAFSVTQPDSLAVDLLFELFFGSTSDAYNQLVVEEQLVDQLFAFGPDSQDPSLKFVIARLNDAADVVRVRDAILSTLAQARTAPVPAARLEQAKRNLRYSTSARLDSTDAIAATLARYVRFSRSYATMNEAYQAYAALTPEVLLAVAQRYVTDERLVVATLANQPLDPAVAEIPPLASLALSGDAEAGSEIAFLRLPSPSQQLSIKLLFESGSADDPAGKHGLAEMTAAMIADAGSAEMTYEEIQKALFPIAGGFGSWVDREQTLFDGEIHADNAGTWIEVALTQLTEPGFREEDFQRAKQNLTNALLQDLRSNNDEELGKEWLQSVVFRGTPYGHPSQGSAAGLAAITLDDVRAFAAAHYTRDNLTVGVAGDLTAELEARLRRALARLPAGIPPQPPPAVGKRPEGIQVEIIQKDTRATAISFGFPIEVTRSHPDYAALYLARTWFGEHRSSMSHLYQRIREARGMNYGDYAYIEAFRGGMYSFFPHPNQARRAQLFEVWIRPVPPEQAHHALRIAIHELDQLVTNGMKPEDFEATREYLSKNVFLLTATQSQRLGYALDSQFYGIGDYAEHLREGLAALTLEQVNAAIRRHLQAQDLWVVMVTKDAEGLKQRLVSDAPSKIEYDSEKPAELLAEDAAIGSRRLGIAPEAVRIVPVAEVFAD